MLEPKGYVQPDGQVTYHEYPETIAELLVQWYNSSVRGYRASLWTVKGKDGRVARAPDRQAAINLFLEDQA